MAVSEIDRLIELLARLPGLGPRSARRAVLHLLKKRESLLMPLATALVLGTRPGPLRRKVFTWWVEADRVALARIGARAEGRDPDVAFEALDDRAAGWHRRGRRLKRWLHRAKGRTQGKRPPATGRDG